MSRVMVSEMSLLSQLERYVRELMQTIGDVTEIELGIESTLSSLDRFRAEVRSELQRMRRVQVKRTGYGKYVLTFDKRAPKKKPRRRPPSSRRARRPSRAA